jgi:putative peptide zinc metalloprotease protein
MLADLVELPNLAAQSARYLGYLIKRYLLRLRDEISPATSRSERLWFGFYGIASALYRVFVTLAIALFVGTRFFFFGVVLALWAVAMMALMPLVKALKSLNAVPAAQERRGQVYGTLAATAVVVALLLAVVPAPFRTQADGVVWLPEQAIVRAAAPGFFRSFETAPDAWVEPGQPLARSVDPALDAQVRLLQAKVDELEASYAAEFVADRARAEIVREQLEHERASLQRAVERLQGLRVASASAGRFTVQQAADLPGRYLKQGAVIGYVIGDGPPVVRVVLDQASVELVARHTRAVEIRLPGALDQALPAQILRQVPSGRGEVSSQALSAAGGGRIAVDPRDPEGRRTLERVFELDVGFATPPAGPLPFGQRVHVRFEHPPEPLAAQAWRAVRRVFLRHFDV